MHIYCYYIKKTKKQRSRCVAPVFRRRSETECRNTREAIWRCRKIKRCAFCPAVSAAYLSVLIAQHTEAHISEAQREQPLLKSREIGQTVSLYLTIYIYWLRPLVRVWSSVWRIKRLQRDGGFSDSASLSASPNASHLFSITSLDEFQPSVPATPIH